MTGKMFFVASFAWFSFNVHAGVIQPDRAFYNVDYQSAGVGGLRGTGSGHIQLSGVNGKIKSASLYWHGPTNSELADINANIQFAGTSIKGINIGFSDSNFWGQLNSQAYKADVTDLVSGNGSYSISGLLPEHTNGASLVVTYDDGDSSNNFDVVTFHGNDANFYNVFDPLGWDIRLDDIHYIGGSAYLWMTVSDGQSFKSGNFFLNGVLLNSQYDPFQGLSLPSTPGSSITNGGLWDLAKFDITSILTPGNNSLRLTHSALSDALSAIHIAVLLPPGAAPDQPEKVSTPSAPLLVLSGLGLLLFRRKAA